MYSSLGNTSSFLPDRYLAPYDEEKTASEGYDSLLLVGFWGEMPGISWTFSAITKQFTLPTTRINVGDGNLKDGMYYLPLSSNAAYYIKGADIVLVASPNGWFSGSDIVGEPVGTGDGSAVDFKTKFGYVTNATVYVDGVAADCAIDTNKPSDAKHSFAGRLRAIDGAGMPTCSVMSGLSDYNSAYFENPYFETIGIDAAVFKYGYLYASQDLADWKQVASVSDRSNPREMTVAEQYKHYRYWKFTGYGSSYTDGALRAIYSTEERTTNIHFATPPAPGAVITADYHTPCIAKDENHVFDFSVTIQLGEFNPDA
jgi:hypothetical protein